MRQTIRQVLDPLISWSTLLIVLTLSSLFSAAAPFGTDALTLSQRTVYFALVVSVALVVLRVVLAGVALHWPDLRGWRLRLVVAGANALVFSPLLWAMAHGLTGHLRSQITPFWAMAALVFGTTIALFHLRAMLGFDTTDPRPRLITRLGGADAMRILHVSGRDHYVEIHTDKGIERLLMRLSDAIAELEGVAGMRVHRSHWVAEEAVRAVSRERGRTFLVLENGSRVPVSRAYRERVVSVFD